MVIPASSLRADPLFKHLYSLASLASLVREITCAGDGREAEILREAAFAYA